MTALWVIVLCGALSIVYAIWATFSVLGADAGTARMQEIAAAVREGAQAYLRRQYLTIAVVGVVIFALLAYFLGLRVAIGFAVGLRGGWVHPTINLHDPDPACDLDYVPHQAREWPGVIALSNSFAFGGQNASIVLRTV